MMKGLDSGFKCPICSSTIEYAIFTAPLWFVNAGVPPYSIHMWCPSCKMRNPLAGQRSICSGGSIEIGGKEYPCPDVEPDYNPLMIGMRYRENVEDDIELRSKEVQSLGEEFMRCIEMILKEHPERIMSEGEME